MSEPTTQAGKALHGEVHVGPSAAEPCHFLRAILAIEQEGARQERERLLARYREVRARHVLGMELDHPDADIDAIFAEAE